ncbi:hemolysin family protein [Rariglobus hedericola]|uniref:HlyC/CorC family transporter n=1 Tax=Rariglobus hedericola TaxID=2597822 RepID=A0A556QL65_9BACT|nr:hemolysin family protein [Rariglobus hedericola]TSJ77351.1 HlyC/CorC family transporter [Rariglobus hedericola]
MSAVLTEILIIFGLLLLNGVFAMAEIAVVSSRKARLKKMADEGSIRAKAALALAEEPTRFLSTVQIGITLVGILAGAFGGVRLSGKLAVWLAGEIPALSAYAEGIAITVVVGAITYLSLIIGELVPKRIGLNNPEGKAMLVAAPMNALSRLALPFVWLLTHSTNGVLKLFGLGQEKDAPPSEEEITHLIEQGTTAGVFHQAEQAMVEGVLRLDEKPVTEIMTRRTKIVWLDVDDADEVNWRKIVASGHSLFPVYEGTRDHVLGMVAVKALWANSAIGLKNRLRDHLTQPLYVPQTINAVQLLESYKKSGKHLALVTDEFGSIQGVVTLIDVMEAIVGDLPEPGDRRTPGAVQRDDGSWLVDGAMDVDEFKRLFSFGALPGEEDDDYETVGGFVLDRLGHIPVESESISWGGWKFEVVDMDRHRVDKLLLAKLPPAT